MRFFKASNDGMFKSIFSDINNRDLLEGLIEEVIGEKVKVEKLNVPEQLKDNIHIKGKTLDIVAKTDNGEINIEVNTSFYKGLNRRNAAFIFKRYSDLLDVGEYYNEMKKVIQINLTNFNEEEKPLKSIYKVMNIEQEEYIDNLIIYEINLTKAKKICYNEKGNKSILSVLDCDKEEIRKINGDGLVEKLKSEVNRLNKDKDFIEFLSKEDEERLLVNTLSYNLGEKDGILQKQLEIAKNLLKQNVDIDIIITATGLTKEELEKLNEVVNKK